MLLLFATTLSAPSRIRADSETSRREQLGLQKNEEHLSLQKNENLAKLSLSQLDCIHKHHKSQHAEDVQVVAGLHALTGGKPGTFLEIGALDGVRFSNTAVLEKCLGWTGLLVEANPQNYHNLLVNIANGKRDSTKVRIEQSAVCNATGGSINMTISGGEVANAPAFAAASFEKAWESRTHPDQMVAVPCRPLSAMLVDHHLTDATFLSLDVEGAEEVVARTFDPSSFQLIMVEADGSAEAKDEAVRRIFSAGGMTMLPRRYGPSTQYNMDVAKWRKSIGLQRYPAPHSASSQVWVRSDAEATFTAAEPLCEPQQPCLFIEDDWGLGDDDDNDDGLALGDGDDDDNDDGLGGLGDDDWSRGE